MLNTLIFGAFEEESRKWNLVVDGAASYRLRVKLRVVVGFHDTFSLESSNVGIDCIDIFIGIVSFRKKANERGIRC